MEFSWRRAGCCGISTHFSSQEGEWFDFVPLVPPTKRLGSCPQVPPHVPKGPPPCPLGPPLIPCVSHAFSPTPLDHEIIKVKVFGCFWCLNFDPTLPLQGMSPLDVIQLIVCPLVCSKGPPLTHVFPLSLGGSVAPFVFVRLKIPRWENCQSFKGLISPFPWVFCL